MVDATHPQITLLVAHSSRKKREALCSIIEGPHLEIVEAEDAEQVKELFYEINPSIVITASELSDGSGFELCRQLSKECRDRFLPILCIIEDTSHQILDALSEAGAADFIEEPFHAPSIKRRLACVMRRIQTDRFLLQSHKQLLEQKRMETIGIFATGMAHNFNNIFASIMATTELLRITCDEIPEVQHGINTITNATHRGAELTASLVSFAAMASPTNTVNCVRPSDVLSEVVNLFTRMDRIGATYELNAPDNLDAVRISTTDFSRVLLELLKNASKAIPHGGRVTTTAAIDSSSPTGKALRIEISDSGKGIPRDKLEHLFIPFYQVEGDDPSLQVALDGRGMGLSTCYNILKSVGGRIQVDETSDSGTTISFAVPLAPAKQAG